MNDKIVCVCKGENLYLSLIFEGRAVGVVTFASLFKILEMILRYLKFHISTKCLRTSFHFN